MLSIVISIYVTVVVCSGTGDRRIPNPASVAQLSGIITSSFQPDVTAELSTCLTVIRRTISQPTPYLRMEVLHLDGFGIDSFDLDSMGFEGGEDGDRAFIVTQSADNRAVFLSDPPDGTTGSFVLLFTGEYYRVVFDL